MRFFRSIGVLCVVALAACASPMMQKTSTKTVDRAFTIRTGGTKSGNTSLHIAVHAENNGGRVQICAAAAARGEKSFEADWPQAMLNRLRVYIDDEKIVSQAPFGATYPGEDTLVGRTANCAVTDAPWRANYENRKAQFKVGRITIRQ